MQTIYERAKDLTGKRGHKKIANNTHVRLLPSGIVALQYHDTNVVLVHPDGCVELNTGNWWTVTTKERMNWMLRQIGATYRVEGKAETRSQSSGDWYATNYLMDDDKVHFSNYSNRAQIQDADVQLEEKVFEDNLRGI